MKLRLFSAVISIFLATTAGAFVLDFNASNQARQWSLVTPPVSVPTNSVNRTTKAIRYFIASDGYSTTNTAAELNAVRASFAQWQSIPGILLKFEEGGLVAPGIDVKVDDGTNVVFWTKTTTVVNGGTSDISGALGVTFSSFQSDNTMIEADIVLNGNLYSWATDFTNTASLSYFVDGVLLHEIGHFIGLNHSPVGGATMLSRGGAGIGTQVGLSSDEVAAARTLYPSNNLAGGFGAVKGQVTKSGTNVFWAAVYAESSAGNLVAGTVTRTNGTYELPFLPPGTYQIRVAPLDPNAGARLVSGPDIKSAFGAADTSFLATNLSTTVSAGVTNTLNAVVVNAAPAFRITSIRSATADSNSYSSSSSPTIISVGQSNLTVGVHGASLPANGSGATLTITGDGLTLGPTTFNNVFGGLNTMSVTIKVSSNATPGLRSFLVTQGTNVAYAHGFLEILPASLDYNFDGLDDVFQRTYFPLFTAANAAPGADPDGDGFPNSFEFTAGTVPTNSASVLRVQSTTTTAGGTTVVWQSVVGKRYQVSSRMNFSGANWLDIGTLVTAAASSAQFLDVTATSGQRFYRVRALP